MAEYFCCELLGIIKYMDLLELGSTCRRLKKFYDISIFFLPVWFFEPPRKKSLFSSYSLSKCREVEATAWRWTENTGRKGREGWKISKLVDRRVGHMCWIVSYALKIKLPWKSHCINPGNVDRGDCSVRFHIGLANAYGHNTLVKSVIKTGQNRLEIMDFLTELDGFI